MYVPATVVKQYVDSTRVLELETLEVLLFFLFLARVEVLPVVLEVEVDEVEVDEVEVVVVD